MSGYPYGDKEVYPKGERHRTYRERFNTRAVRTR